MHIEIDTDRQVLIYSRGTAKETTYPLYEADALRVLSDLWIKCGWNCKYSYDFEWLGRRVIQMPDDIVRLQELIWKTKPTVIVETGTAHGGSTVFFASMMELLGRGKVVSVDIEIRPHNRAGIEAHPLLRRITLIERSSIDEETIGEVRAAIAADDRVMVFLDSCHEKHHVARELELYGALVTPGCYAVVADGVMSVLSDVPRGSPEWAAENPMAAAREFLKEHPEFKLDPTYTRTGVTYLQGGYLRRT